MNARWDNEASVLLGDFLFTHAFYLASTLPTPLACRLIGHATNIVCEGELRQKGMRGQFEASEADYFSVVEAKTAELCAVSCQLGAHYAGAAEPLVRDLADYGRDLGMAFQIADDLLDLQGDEQTTGKSLGTDVYKQRPTLPIIHLLAQASAAERNSVVAALLGETDDPLATLLPSLQRHGSCEYARQVALGFAQRAASRLERLPASPARETLRLLAEFVVVRSR